MYDILTAADSGAFRVTFGGDVMTDWEIRQQLLSDLRFVAIAVGIAIIMLILATRSPVLTVFALLQILVSFPIAYTLYAGTGNTSLSVIQFLAPFVILGIGLDDVFVFVGIYRALMAYSHRFDIATRLHVAWKRASGAMLATSATSAVAFAANAISPVPAVRLFGILLAALVATNYVLAVTWLPISVVVWEQTLRGCCGLFGSRGGDGGSAAAAAESPTASIAAASATNQVGSVSHTPHAAGAAGASAAAISGAVSHGVPTKTRAAKPRPLSAQVLCSGRHLWRVVFNGIWRARLALIPALLGVTAFGALFASRLEPSDSLPQLFDDSHNVQRFLDIWSENFTDDSIFACATCLLLSTNVNLEEFDNVQLDFAPPGNATGTASPTGPTGGADAGSGTGAPNARGDSTVASAPAGISSAVNASTPSFSPAEIDAQVGQLSGPPPLPFAIAMPTPPDAPEPSPAAAAAPIGVREVVGGVLSAVGSGSSNTSPSTPAATPGAPAPAGIGTVTEGADNPTAGDASGVTGGSATTPDTSSGGTDAPSVGPGAQAPAEGPVDTTAAPPSPLDAVEVDQQVLTAERVNLNTIPVAVLWGVRSVGASNSTDPFSEDAAGRVELDVAFDLGEVAQQQAVLAQVGTPTAALTA